MKTFYMSERIEGYREYSMPIDEWLANELNKFLGKDYPQHEPLTVEDVENVLNNQGRASEVLDEYTDLANYVQERVIDWCYEYGPDDEEITDSWTDETSVSD